ncbi:uncharacterized protein LOC129700544 isoform X4 [Leucoraja erinacea]|uniref:uncharacterized protein LOC129700544 isoform X4 n=1 Tax=Leucoraja erinaceus TaxID=7782 RepID=UPI002454499A|nr:uncharacterized protein LOC129700544 isoform X4 [Leucoraja erinacea]
MPGRRKKIRRLRCRAREFVDGANIYTPPDSMDMLATKYKEKCKVESSTESDSDACTTESLDPYDGDLESTSSESDGSRQFLQDVYTEKSSYLSHAIVAVDRRKLSVKPYKQSLLTTFLPVCSNTELNSIQGETAAIGGILPQSSCESEVLFNGKHELAFATSNYVADAGHKSALLDLDMLARSPTINLDIESDHRLVNMFVLHDPGTHEARHSNVQWRSGKLLKTAHESFPEGKVSAKRKIVNPLNEASNEWISKKKSRILKTEVSNFVLKWSV